MEFIASPRNPLLKEIRRALSRGSLTSDGCAVAETFHLLEEALRSEREIPVVLAAHSVRTTVSNHIRKLNGVRFAVIPDALFGELGATESSQGVIALVRPPEWTLDELIRGRTLLVALDGVQDPGNAGAVVRSAEAFGATGVLFLKGTVSPFNPKTLRAAAGSLFRVPVASGVDPVLARTALAQKKVAVYAAVPGARKLIAEVDFRERVALLIGNEGAGVSAKLRSAAMDVSIPTTGVESLNAAVAASILLYEASRQRRQAGVGV